MAIFSSVLGWRCINKAKYIGNGKVGGSFMAGRRFVIAFLAGV
jgi:hypothetical protein